MIGSSATHAFAPQRVAPTPGWRRPPGGSRATILCVRLRLLAAANGGGDMKINWLRVLGGGFLIEVVLAIVLIGGFAAAGIDLANGVSTVSAVIIGGGCFVGAFLVVAWLARGIERQRAWNGLLMGVVATLLYVGLIA